LKRNKNKYNITVNKTDAIIILSENLETQFLVSEDALNDENDISDHITIMTAIITRMNHDPNFADDMIDWLEHFQEPSSTQRWN